MFSGKCVHRIIQFFNQACNQCLYALFASMNDMICHRGIKCITLFKQLLQLGSRIGSLQQRAIVVMTGTLPQIMHPAFQIDYNSVPFQNITIVCFEYRAATGSQYYVVELYQILNDRTFSLTKALLALNVEYMGYFHAGAFLYFLIAIDECFT